MAARNKRIADQKKAEQQTTAASASAGTGEGV